MRIACLNGRIIGGILLWLLSVGVAAARVVAPPATAAIKDSRSAGGRTGADGSGNVTALINESQAVVARYLYDPFGNVVASSGPLADANRYRFSSKELHPNSGLVYYGYRYYEPSLQRWINRDPIGVRGGVNLYGFVGNGPLGMLDPFGLEGEKVVGKRMNGSEGLAGLRRIRDQLWSYYYTAQIKGIDAALFLDDLAHWVPGYEVIRDFPDLASSIGTYTVTSGRSWYYAEESEFAAEEEIQALENEIQIVFYALNFGGKLQKKLVKSTIGNSTIVSGSIVVTFEKKAAKTATHWANPKTLADHFARHGADFGAKTADDYARMASDFFRRSQAERLPTKIAPDGTIRVYDPKNNIFGSYNPSGTTKTFYKPDPAQHGLPSNLDYWNKQPGIPPWQP